MGGPIKTLVCSDSYYPPRGGGDISLRLIVSHLHANGYDVSACYIGRTRDPDIVSYPQDLATGVRGLWPRQWVIGKKWKGLVRRTIQETDPALVIVQQTVAAATAQVCAESSVPFVVVLNSVDQFCLGSFWGGHPWKCMYNCLGCNDSGPRTLQYPFFLAEVMRMRKFLPKAAGIVVNSVFMQATLKSLWGLDSHVATPIVPPFEGRQPVEMGGDILFFSPVQHKGVDIALNLAKAMPGEHFTFVGDAKERTKNEMLSVGNLRYIPWTSDVETIFSKGKLLIVPSVVPEGFGRVCLEAMNWGIPCVASAVGALPETVGDGGSLVSRHRDLDAWIEALRPYSDARYLAEKSEAARAHARTYSTSAGMHTLSEWLRSVVDV